MKPLRIKRTEPSGALETQSSSYEAKVFAFDERKSRRRGISTPIDDAFLEGKHRNRYERLAR